MEGEDEMAVLINVIDNANSRKGKTFFEGPFEDAFWEKLDETYQENGIWSDALNEAHYHRVIKHAEAAKVDPAVYLINNVVDQYWMLKRPMLEFPSYENHVTRIMKIVLDKDAESVGGYKKSKYNRQLDADKNGVYFSLLHLAAKQNLKEVCELIMERYEGLQHGNTYGLSNGEKLPVEYALEKTEGGMSRDATAAVLLRSMLNERVRLLFEFDDGDPPRVSFLELVARPDMKRTVAEVLNTMISPDWPYVLMREGDEDELEKEWQKDPNLPIRYHFFYQILDQDENGRPPMVKKSTDSTSLEDNLDFNHMSTSGLKALSQGPLRKFAVKHPVVRRLIQRKWDLYGFRMIWCHAALYLLFLTLLSLALILAGHDSDLLKYDNSLDIFRGVCEIGVLIFSVAYIVDEFCELQRDRKHYFEDLLNILDIFGLVLIIVIVPLRLKKIPFQWYIASMAFMINFVRGAKYLFAWEAFGTYARVLTDVLRKDMTIFMSFYGIVLCGFTGGIYLAMKGAGNLDKVNGFGDIVLRGVRALVEGKEFSEEYDGFNGFVLLLILLNMLVILVFLLNMLIAQLSFRYEVASQDASVEYDIDKIKLTCKIENSRFWALNLRRRFYSDGDYINDIDTVEDYVSVWNKTVKKFGLVDKKKLLEDAQKVWTKKVS